MVAKAWTLLLFLFCSPLILYAQSAISGVYKETDNNVNSLNYERQWWKSFQDPLLDSLINEACDKNFTILGALKRIDMAKANWHIERALAFPSISFEGGWSNQQVSANTEHGVREHNRNFSAIIDASWEVDIFGGIRQRVKAQHENFLATREEFEALQLSLSAQVASAYINLRESQQKLLVVQKNCESQAAVLAITENRFKSGLVSKLDVAQARSVYYSTRASLPQLEVEISQYINQIAILLGRFPQDLEPILYSVANLPEHVEIVTNDIPIILLMQRPDVRQAEYVVKSKVALLDASKRDFLPNIILNASIGCSSHKIKQLLKKNSFIYELSPTLSWTLFNGGKLLNSNRLSKADWEECVQQFNSTLLSAVQESENALNSYHASLKQIVAMREVCLYGEETLQLSLDLYKQGLTPFQNVLDSLRSLLTYQNQLIQVQGYSLLQLISLYKAVGGGWTY